MSLRMFPTSDHEPEENYGLNRWLNGTRDWFELSAMMLSYFEIMHRVLESHLWMTSMRDFEFKYLMEEFRL